MGDTPRSEARRRMVMALKPSVLAMRSADWRISSRWTGSRRRSADFTVATVQGMGSGGAPAVSGGRTPLRREHPAPGTAPGDWRRMESLRGKIAVVTGAGSGIGRATALALARQGAVVALADLDASSAKETGALLDGVSGTSVHQVDVTSESAMRAFVEDVIAEHGAVDVVVNNAGIAPAPGAAQDLPLSTYRRIMDVYYWGM